MWIIKASVCVILLIRRLSQITQISATIILAIMFNLIQQLFSMVSNIVANLLVTHRSHGLQSYKIFCYYFCFSATTTTASTSAAAAATAAATTTRAILLHCYCYSFVTTQSCRQNVLSMETSKRDRVARTHRHLKLACSRWPNDQNISYFVTHNSLHLDISIFG